MVASHRAADAEETLLGEIEQFVAMNGIKFLLTMLSTATDIDILDEVSVT